MLGISIIMFLIINLELYYIIETRKYEGKYFV